MTKQQHDRVIEIQKRFGEIEKEKAQFLAEATEIEKRGATEKDAEKLAEINSKLDEFIAERGKLTAELTQLKAQPEELREIPFKKEQKDMITIEQKRKSKDYEIVWAKHFLGKPMTEQERSLFDEVNSRALGVATTTTATTYVAPTTEVDGVNNGGVFVPQTISLDILNELMKTSPFFARITRLGIRGGVNFPYAKSNSGAKWYAEGTATEDQSIEFATLSLGGYELAKYIKITWKLEAMSVDGFLSYIRRELIEQCGKALIKAMFYGAGAGSTQPTGATVGALEVTEAGYTDLFAEMKGAYAKLDAEGREDAVIGAEFFVSQSVMDKITFAQDENGRYQFNALTQPTTFGGYRLNVDPYLASGDFVFGNPAHYILNEQEAIGVLAEAELKFRRNGYSAYGLYDGKPIPNAFVFGTEAE